MRLSLRYRPESASLKVEIREISQISVPITKLEYSLHILNPTRKFKLFAKKHLCNNPYYSLASN